ARILSFASANLLFSRTADRFTRSRSLETDSSPISSLLMRITVSSPSMVTLYMPFHLLNILINGRRRPGPWAPARTPGKFPEKALNPGQLIITLNLRAADIQINERICLRKSRGSVTLNVGVQRQGRRSRPGAALYGDEDGSRKDLTCQAPP